MGKAIMSAGAACYRQTCDQVITGRQFQYDEALTIIQDEEYLEDADFDDIKRYYIYKKIGKVDTDFNIPKSNQYSNWMPKQSNENYQYNGKYSKNHYNHMWRQQNKNESQTYSSYKYETEFEPVVTDTYDESKLLSRKKRCPSCTCLYYDSSTCSCPYGGPCTDDSAKTAMTITASANTTTTTDETEEALETAAQAAGALGAGMIGMAMMMPDLNFQQNGGTPGGSTPAGTVGGGGLPSDGSISTAALSLALVPAGLAAVAIFPPFVRPRTVPAVAVIFNEPRDTTTTVKKRDVRRLYHTIKKRSPSPFFDSEFWIGNTKVGLPSYSQIKYAVQKKPKKTVDFVTAAWNSLSQFRVWIAKKMYKALPRDMKKLVKKFGRIEAIMHKVLVCIEPRLKRRYGKLVYPEGLTVKAVKEKKENFWDFVKYGNAEDAEVEYIEDCFADMERPRFGWRAKVTFMENEPCEIDSENPERSTCRINSISNNEDETNYYYAQSRQTGENFRSAAPPECRVEYVCNTPPPQPPIPTQPDPDQIAPAQPALAQPDSAQLAAAQSVPAQPLTNQAVPQE